MEFLKNSVLKNGYLKVLRMWSVCLLIDLIFFSIIEYIVVFCLNLV